MICYRCGVEFTPKRKNNTKYCSRPCQQRQSVTNRRRAQKTKIVQHLGGKCVRCGWNEHQSGLITHHLDPSTKDYGISQMGSVRKWDHIVKELEKCILLCSNCHAVVHALRIDLSALAI
jgi:hypothetical protein